LCRLQPWRHFPFVIAFGSPSMTTANPIRRYFTLERLLHLERPSELNGTARKDPTHRSLCDDHQIGRCKQRPGVYFGNEGTFGADLFGSTFVPVALCCLTASMFPVFAASQISTLGPHPTITTAPIVVSI